MCSYFATTFRITLWKRIFHCKEAVLATYSKIRYLKTAVRQNIDKRSFEDNKEIKEYLRHIVHQHSELTERLTTSGNEMSSEKRRTTGKTLSKYSTLVKISKEIDMKEKDLVELQSLIKDGGNEMRELVQEESLEYEEELDQLKEQLLRNLVPQEDEDDNDAILEVRAGTGGQEAGLFTMEMFLMYQKFSSFKNWKFSALRVSKSESGGFKEASASISGDGVFGALKHETGVHRVQRVPATESMGRLHTSTMTVAVLPEPEEIDITLNQQDIKIDTFRASGAGGQHVNTTDSAVRITHVPTGIVVANQEERSQIKNKQKAMQILRAKLFQVEREAADKKRSLTRRQQIGTGERSEKIRTYNFPQNRVTDHRVGVSMNGIDEFLAGESSLQEMIDTLQKHHQTKALEQILQDYKME